MPAQLALRWTGGQPRVELRGSPGRNYIIQAGSDLTDWVAISGPTNVLDPGFINQPARFYRRTRFRSDFVHRHAANYDRAGRTSCGLIRGRTEPLTCPLTSAVVRIASFR